MILTVNQLLEECEKQKAKGNGNKMVGLKYNSENKIYDEAKRDWNINENKVARRR